MLEDLTTAFEITIVGMALVFGAIVLLWGVMAALVRLTPDPIDEANSPDEIELKKRAAIAAVAVALARETSQTAPHEFPLPETAIVSAWQAV
ncbi:MAG: hypothetical protein GYB65_23110, partial [Chloroflexi bacterium]|nr:hypothetical protein [Chloroflexota bacterium]